MRALARLLLAIIVLSACQKSSSDQTVKVACASNAYPAMAEITRLFSEITGHSCELINGSSGKLAAQIREGAPFDLFISADMRYPETLFHDGFSLTEPAVYAYGKIVLWTTVRAQTPDLSILTDPSVKKIAIANPETAPYGKAAMEFFDTYQLSAKISQKLIYGESIGQTNQFILSGAVPVGITSLSSVRSVTAKNRGHWKIIPVDSYSPIQQGLIKIDRKRDNEEAVDAFYQFVFSEEAKEILLKYGYSINE